MKRKLFDLLISDNKEEINNFIIENGKSPKIISPIQIVKPKKGENENGKE